MSDTIVDMAKVTQMLDTGHTVTLFRNELGSYTAIASRPPRDDEANLDLAEIDAEGLHVIDTDDFTLEQALTRLAYKVHGEIL